MRPRRTFSLFAFAGLPAASQPLLAAAPKIGARATKLVAGRRTALPGG